jgi:hypothetical protein
LDVAPVSKSKAIVIDLTIDDDEELHSNRDNRGADYSISFNNQINSSSLSVQTTSTPKKISSHGPSNIRKEQSDQVLNSSCERPNQALVKQGNLISATSPLNVSTNGSIKTNNRNSIDLHDNTIYDASNNISSKKSPRTITDVLMANRPSKGVPCSTLIEPICLSTDASIRESEVSVKSSSPVAPVPFRREREGTPRKRKQTNRFCEQEDVRQYMSECFENV